MYKAAFQPAMPGVVKLSQVRLIDARGSFSQVVNTDDLHEYMRPAFLQLNTAVSKQGVLRGMHRQDQSKLVFPVSGRIFDVALNPETGEWFGCELDEHSALFIPPQYAHGYLVLSETAVVQYLVDAPYAPDKEEQFKWDAYGINWPLQITPTLSIKDAQID